MIKYSVLIFFLLVGDLAVFGQSPIVNRGTFCRDSSWCEPGIDGMLPSRWIEAYYEKSTLFAGPNDNTEISNFRRAGFKARMPLLNLPGLKLIGGVAYQQEYMSLASVSLENPGPWSTINMQHINTRSMDLIWMTPFRGKAYGLGRVSAGIHNAKPGIHIYQYRKDMQFSLSQLLVVRPDDTREYGLGMYIRKGQGKMTTYPVFLYNQTFSSRWGIEALLPSYFRVRRNLGPKSALVAQVKATGTAFNMEFAGTAGDENLSVRRSEAILGVSFQQEIIDPLWISLELGIRKPLGLSVFDAQAPRDILARTPLAASTYFNASIYIVPPKKLMQKLSKPRTR
jgi:hypothetical protein